ncbi:hypothetical protein [Burkholderia plantarii]|uniref:hypothetical protein n=1 Tax=Burkholderia plantarii TaxID=41899 RepID=UPI0014960D6E|nr:hypothetical protein [Burkholderia plantarii]
MPDARPLAYAGTPGRQGRAVVGPGRAGSLAPGIQNPYTPDLIFEFDLLRVLQQNPSCSGCIAGGPGDRARPRRGAGVAGVDACAFAGPAGESRTTRRNIDATARPEWFNQECE